MFVCVYIKVYKIYLNANNLIFFVKSYVLNFLDSKKRLLIYLRLRGNPDLYKKWGRKTQTD